MNIVSSKEGIDLLAPTHCRTSCSDEGLENSYVNIYGYYRCARCAMLRALRDKWDTDVMTVSVSVIAYNPKLKRI